jgi:hypothetical protein
MKHATSASLDRINALLDEIRGFDELREKSRGVFYLKSRAFLHFHEDDETMYADVRLSGPDFDRFCLKASSDRRRLVSAIRRISQQQSQAQQTAQTDRA